MKRKQSGNGDWLFGLGRGIAALAFLLLTGCSIPGAPATPVVVRPKCADAVARAIIFPTPASGAFQCLTPEMMRKMSDNDGVNSDDALQAQVAANVPPADHFSYELRLPDGGYVYTVLIHPDDTKPPIRVDVVVYCDSRGSVESFTFFGDTAA